MDLTLPPIPAKRYFTIGEVSELCAVKPHVLRYWEQEFSQLKPIKRRGNRRYYQHHEVLLIRRIRSLLYEQGFTISGARQQLHLNVSKEKSALKTDKQQASVQQNPLLQEKPIQDISFHPEKKNVAQQDQVPVSHFAWHEMQTFDIQVQMNKQPVALAWQDYEQIRQELLEICEILDKG